MALFLFSYDYFRICMYSLKKKTLSGILSLLKKNALYIKNVKTFPKALKYIGAFAILAEKPETMEYVNEEKRPHCLECGHELYGRPDRKFCSSVCKNHWHNRKNHSARAFRVKILNALEKNYSILEKLLRLNMHSMDNSDLVQLGFKPEYFTSFRKVGIHSECRCFDIRYYRSTTKIWRIERTISTLSRPPRREAGE